MNRIGFRLPQAALSLVFRRALARCLLLPAPVSILLSILVLGLVPGTLSAVHAAESQASSEPAEAPAEAPDEERSVVYSLRDHESAKKTAEDYISDYAGEDGVQRSLEGPDVVITAGVDRTVYEYRQNGQLRLVKIIPRIGRPYYLVPADQTRGFGDLGQADMLLPQWTIVEF